MLRFLPLPLLALVIGTSLGLRDAPGRTGGGDLLEAALSFMNTLEQEDGASKALLDFEDKARRTWHFVPGERAGLTLGEMPAESRRAVHRMLRASLSETGYLQVVGILGLEDELRRLESRPGREAAHRDPGLYTVALFGKPTEDGPWGWRFEGHHASINVTCIGARVVSATPIFLGTNPMEVPDGVRAGYRVLAEEEDLARALIAGLDEGQRRRAFQGPKLPGDVVNGPGAVAPAITTVDGLPLRETSESVQRIAGALLDAYRRDAAAGILAAIDGPGTLSVRDAELKYFGDPEGRGRFAYELRSREEVIEFVMTGDNHVHTLWRSGEADFGAGALARHLEGAEHRDDRLVLDFEDLETREGFCFSDPTAWAFESSEQGSSITLLESSEYSPPHRSPHSIALLAEPVYGSFRLECEMQQTGREYGHRDLCLFFGFQSPASFYYVHVASVADDHAHGVFAVDGAPRVRIDGPRTEGVDWGQGEWHHVQLERDVEAGTIRVAFDGTVVIEARDDRFSSGRIGFGSFDDTGRIRRVKIHGDPIGRVEGEGRNPFPKR